MILRGFLAFATWLSLILTAQGSETQLQVGFAEVDITPQLTGDRPVWLAGYGQNRAATGIHDPIFARAVVLEDKSAEEGHRKIALVSLDLIGLQRPAVQLIRSRVEGFDYVVVCSTHNHEGPDVIGIYGPSSVQSGVDSDYIDLVVDRSAKAIRTAEENSQTVCAELGTASDESLLSDSRLPKAKDGVLRVLKFLRKDNQKLVGILVQWNCHPETMGSQNKLITADFVGSTVEYLKKKYRVPVVYFTGPVGGLMAPPYEDFKDDNGTELDLGDFRFRQSYGVRVGRLAESAMAECKPIELTPMYVAARPIVVPVANPLYHLAWALGVVDREGRSWAGSPEKLGPVLGSEIPKSLVIALETEVACLRLGQLRVVCIPGEIYPELIYGKYQDPVDPGADFPDVTLEKPLVELLPDDRFLVFGLANDEIGYIIPKRQWDEKPPHAYGRDAPQYGEGNSVGPATAPIIMKSLEELIRQSAQND